MDTIPLLVTGFGATFTFNCNSSVSTLHIMPSVLVLEASGTEAIERMSVGPYLEFSKERLCCC